MTIFQIPADERTAAEKLSEGFLAEANQEFDRELQSVYDAVQRFWFRNTDEDGNPSASSEGENPEPTGPEILTAMGTNAAALIQMAQARVQMLLSIQASLGIDVVDMSKVSGPFTLEFNADGSLKTATPV